MISYIATCRSQGCLWQRAPARFTGYDQRATATGQHRLNTGHAVTYSEEHTEPCVLCNLMPEQHGRGGACPTNDGSRYTFPEVGDA